MFNTQRTPRITLLGSNSGRNAGDAAILGAIMKALCKSAGRQLYFEVPTTHPSFVKKEYGPYFDVTPVNVMPWTGSLRLLGIPTFRSIKRTDVTMITNGIIFDVALWNPIFNYLITLIFLVPWAKFCGKKVVCYNVGVGPLESFFGRLFAKWVGNQSDLILCRDEESRDLLRSIGVNKTIFLTADSVFQGWPAEKNLVDQMVKDSGLSAAFEENRVLGVNVTRYVDRWLRSDQKVKSSEDFTDTLAQSLTLLRISKNIEPALVLTQVMDYDFGVNLAEQVSEYYFSETGKHWKPAIISNRDYNNHAIMGFCARCRLFVGMRVHSLILACRAGTPVVGLVYAPKVRSFLSRLGSEEYSLELADITEQLLTDTLLKAWGSSDSLQTKQQEVQAELELAAKEAADLVVETCFAPSDVDEQLENPLKRANA